MNLASLIETHPADANAIMSRGDLTTYGLLREQVAALRGGLSDLGLERGDRLAIICGNNWYFVVSYLAALGCGYTAVPLNPLSPGRELTNQLAQVGARAVVVGPSGRSSFSQVERGELSQLDHVIECGEPEPGAHALDDLLAAPPRPIVELDPEDLAVLLFTSGTVGLPKAAMLSHRAMVTGLRTLAAVPGGGLTAADVTFSPLPLFHVYGLAVSLGASLAAGATVVLAERFDPASAIETIMTRSVTVIAGPPTLWSALAQLPEVTASDVSSIRIAISGAAPLSSRVARAVREHLGIALSQGYGLTETASVACSARGTEAPIGSIGRPLPGVAVRLVDQAGRDVLIGDEGEVLVKSDVLFSGYWGDPAASAQAVDPDGWLHTGDIAVVDEAGHLFLVDRSKDLIIVSGFNVFPAEVEDVVADHPAVDAVGVVGVPHPHTGEAVKAFVVVADGQAVEEDDIIEFVGQRLARYKCPTKVLFVDALPEGVGGKLLRRELR